MKTIKRLIVLLVCFVLLSNCLSMNVAAEDLENDIPIYTVDDLIDWGFVDVGDGIFAYTGEDDPFASGISLFFSPEKNCPDFDVVKDVPWYSFPQYIKDIMYMSLEDLTVDPGVPFKLPFICVTVETNGNVNIWLGINVGLGQMNDASLNLAIYAVTYNDIALENIYPYSCLYRYAFNYKTNKVNLNWTVQNPTNFGTWYPSSDSSITSLRRFSPWNLANQETSVDFYCFGANGVYYASRRTSFTVRRSNVDANLVVAFHTPRLGFGSGDFVPYQDISYDHNYFAYFSPPTYDDYQLQLQEEQNDLIEEGNETSKGIWETLKQIPSQIGSFFENLKNYLLYFQETKPEHVNPFAGILDGIQSFFDEQIADTDDFKSSLDTTFNNISGYIQTGSNVINRLLAGVPILNTVVVFLLAFAVIRKVVGR